MPGISRLRNILIAKIITRFPSLAERFIDSYSPWESEDIPWTPAAKPLNECTVAIVSTAGVHHRDQKPFDMQDPHGDPSFRVLDMERPVSDLMITHDYYDHSDADKDINIIFPVDRLREFEKEKIIGRLARCHYSFMGHIVGPHLYTLTEVTAPEVASRLTHDGVDAVLLTPG